MKQTHTYTHRSVRSTIVGSIIYIYIYIGTRLAYARFGGPEVGWVFTDVQLRKLF